MKDLEILRGEPAVRALVDEIGREAAGIGRPLQLMEVCGTHTMTVYRNGLGPVLRRLGVTMISGPGCPVCVTPDSTISAAASLVREHEGVILASFGDMLRVPTSEGILMKLVPAARSEIRIVYSAEETLRLARENPDRSVVFLAAGFETTIPSIAWVVRECVRRDVRNVFLLSAMKTVPAPLRAILSAGEVRLDGLIYPGHVSVIIGTHPYEFIPKEFGVPGAVAGFEPADFLLGVLAVLQQIRGRRPAVENAYPRAVRAEGNPEAVRLIAETLHPADAEWRGFGTIPQSGLLPPERFSALARFNPRTDAVWTHEGCRCGEVVRGLIAPEGCPLFARTCTPGRPLGPCMVSFEGACLIHAKYGKEVPGGQD